MESQSERIVLAQPYYGSIFTGLTPYTTVNGVKIYANTIYAMKLVAVHNSPGFTAMPLIEVLLCTEHRDLIMVNTDNEIFSIGSAFIIDCSHLTIPQALDEFKSMCLWYNVSGTRKSESLPATS